MIYDVEVTVTPGRRAGPDWREDVRSAFTSLGSRQQVAATDEGFEVQVRVHDAHDPGRAVHRARWEITQALLRLGLNHEQAAVAVGRPRPLPL